MPSVLDRSALEQSPLADLHLLANELGVDGFRRLRKPDLVDAILARQSGDEAAVGAGTELAGVAAEPADAVTEPAEVVAESAEAAAESAEAAAEPAEEGPGRGRGGRRGGRGRRRGEEEGAVDRDEPADAPAEREDRVVEGTVELLANGSGFVRLSPPDPTDDDVYISAAQVKRCELVSGDRVGGPMRAPRRSERFPSLIRVDTINGRPAEEVAEGTRFDDLAVAWPSERLELGSDDVTLKAIEWLTPFGKGSRVLVAGPARAGKSETVKRLVDALAGREGLEVSVVLAGVRPEEIAEWGMGPVPPVSAVSFAAPPDVQSQAVEHAIEQGRRVAARGGDAVVVVDSLGGLAPHAAKRALSAARNIENGGSLTVIATAPEPFGGETTVIAL